MRKLMAVLLFSTASVFAQSVTIGNDVSAPNASAGSDASVTQTYIDLEHPATATGTLRRAKFHWSSSDCPGGVMLKFYRRSGATLKVSAVRGPFTVTANLMDVTLNPVVSIQEGDLIAITKLQNCGNATSVSVESPGYLRYSGDVGDVQIADGQLTHRTLAVSALGDATHITARVLPVVGSAPGNFGSYFKTAVQLFNPYSVTLTGSLVFHRAGTNGIASDPSVTYTIPPGGVVSFPDVVAAIGQTGIGSLDVVVENGSEPPQLTTRVYNDAGALGTTGLYEEAIDPHNDTRVGNKLLTDQVSGFLVTPENPNATRMNIGIRTLGAGATIRARLRSATGEVLQTVTKSYGSNWFEQTTADAFIGMPIGANQTIEIFVEQGEVIVYGSSTDNITNDPAVQFVVSVFAVT